MTFKASDVVVSVVDAAVVDVVVVAATVVAVVLPNQQKSNRKKTFCRKKSKLDLQSWTFFCANFIFPEARTGYDPLASKQSIIRLILEEEYDAS